MIDFLLWLDIEILRVGTLGKSRPGETISAASWSLYLDKKWQGRVFVPLIDLLFRPLQKDHCRQAYEWQIDLYKDSK